MVNFDERTRSMHIYGFSRILPTIHQRFFEDRKSDHRTTKEKQEVCLEREMHIIISKY
jgi:hypothetical protein